MKKKKKKKRLQLISVDGIVLGGFLFVIDRILVHGSVWRLIHHPTARRRWASSSQLPNEYLLLVTLPFHHIV
jgi:hypothetical protein